MCCLSLSLSVFLSLSLALSLISCLASCCWTRACLLLFRSHLIIPLFSPPLLPGGHSSSLVLPPSHHACASLTTSTPSSYLYPCPTPSRATVCVCVCVFLLQTAEIKTNPRINGAITSFETTSSMSQNSLSFAAL